MVNSIAHIVEFIEDSEHLTDYLRKMGKRHNEYGAQPEHFAWVGEALLATFAYYFDKQWTPELSKSWTAAFQFISNEMTIGMKMQQQVEMQTQARKVVEMKKEEAPSPPTLDEIAKKVAHELIKKAIADEVASESFQLLIEKRRNLY